MSRIKSISFITFLLAIFTTANAQVTTSSINGKVSDEEGVLAGAVITATHLPSGSMFYTVSNESGYYQLSAITPGGPYSITFEMLGCKKTEILNIEAPLGETVAIDGHLQKDSISLDELVVVADRKDSAMNINRSGAGTAISQKRMESMPTATRNLNDMIRLTPQATITQNGFAIGGGNYRSSYITVDGAAFNNAFGIESNLPAGGSPISLDAIEQISVKITPFDVRQSGFTGGAINAVTKRGTNQFHASVYNYFNNDQLLGDRIGKTDDDKLVLNRSLKNTTGITFGGPIVKNKLFFFVNAEYSPDSTPGNVRIARKNESEDYGGSLAVARPTEAFMNEVSQYLKDQYGYNPGRYQNYSVSTPDWKIIARIDWNISRDHKFNFKISHTSNAYSAKPSSSTTPLRYVYDKYKEGRNSEYAMYFESSRYVQGQDFTAISTELNSRFLDGKAGNVFRLAYSHQHEERSNVGGIFPTVDILAPYDDGNAVITSFGPDPFTYGNLREVHTVVATDEFNYATGFNNILAGIQIEWDYTRNGFMQGGAGYYTYRSWDDFKNDAQPTAFAITFPNNNALKQEYPSFQYLQTSLYIQDEMKLSNRFHLTAGLRFEIPIYPKVKENNNLEFAHLADESKTMRNLRTEDMPMARFSASPRLGFNWDILGNRNLILRGGTGIYTGRIPFVWIVSSVANSNCKQIQYIDNKGTNPKTPSFHTNVKDIVNDIYDGNFVQSQNNPAPSAATIMDKNLKMPSSWKTSLALEGYLPGEIRFNIEGIFNKDINSVHIKKLGIIKKEGGLHLPGEPEPRTTWEDEGIKNSLGSYVNPLFITNSKKVNGYYGSITAQLSKDFRCGLSLAASYTYSNSKTISEGVGDQVGSAFNSANYTVHGNNNAELGYSTFVTPHRVLASINYHTKQGQKGATTIGIFYEGYNECNVGGYGASRYSYTMKNISGDWGANNLIFIPTEEQLESMTFSNPEDKIAFDDFITSDKYLSKHRGEYLTRGALIAPWRNTVNFKFAQDINFKICKKVNTIQFGLDIRNVGNLLNPDWGVSKRLKSDNILNFDKKKGTYKFFKPAWSKYNSLSSTWEMLISVKYSF